MENRLFDKRDRKGERSLDWEHHEDVNGSEKIGAAKETLTPSLVQPWVALAGWGGRSHLCLSLWGSPSLPMRVLRECCLSVPRRAACRKGLVHCPSLSSDCLFTAASGAWGLGDGTVCGCRLPWDSLGSPFCVLWEKPCSSGSSLSGPLMTFIP